MPPGGNGRHPGQRLIAVSRTPLLIGPDAVAMVIAAASQYRRMSRLPASAQRTGAPRLAARTPPGAQGASTLSRMARVFPASASAAW